MERKLAKDEKNKKDCGCEDGAKTPEAGKKNSVIIDVNPTLEGVDLLKFNKTAVVTLLKMSPPSKQHDEFIDHLWDVAIGHSVEAPMVFIQDFGAEGPVETSVGGDGQAVEPEGFFWLDPSDSFALANEAYGDIIQEAPIGSVYSLIEKLLSSYTDIVLVLPEDEVRYVNRKEHNIEVLEYRDFDETAIAYRLYNLAVANSPEFESELAEGIEYLAPELIDIYAIADSEEEFGEALTYGQRLKRAQIFRRNKRKIAVARERMRHKIASTDKLKVRARKKAIQSIRKKVAGARGVDYNNLSVGEKIQIDKRVEQRKGAIGRIAAKILPKLRKDELKKIQPKKPTNEGVAPDLAHSPENEANKRKQNIQKKILEDFDMASLPTNQARALPHRDGVEPSQKKRWHEMFKKDGSIKLDKRFKIWRDSSIEEAVEMVVEDPEVAKTIEALIEKAEEYNIDQNVIVEVFNRGMKDIDYDHLSPVQAGFNRVNSFIAGSYFLEDVALMERAEANACAIITREELKELERFADALLDKFGIDIEFTKHFGERMSDDRNNPCIKVQELRDFFRKLALRQGKDIKNAREAEIVIKDIQKDLNVPVVIDYNKGEFEVTLKTIMRKKNFTTPNPVVKI